MITLSAAQSMLRNPERIPELLDTMERMSNSDLDALSLLMFDVIDMEDRALSLSILKRLIAQRPHWVTQENNTLGFKHSPLMIAIKHACLDTVNFLLDAGASVHTVDVRGLNALDYVGRMDFTLPDLGRICEVLIKKGGVGQTQKNSALYYAASRANLAVVETLLSHGADFTKTTRDGTALGSACLVQESSGPVLEIVKAMLQTFRGRQVIDWGWHLPDEEYGAPIHCAAYSGNMSVLSLLVEYGARLNPSADQSQAGPDTPLMKAALGVKPEAVDFLIKSGADVTQVNAKGENALHFLAGSDSYESDGTSTPEPKLLQTAKILVSAGVDPFLKNSKGLSPQDTARENEHLLLADYLASITSARDLKSTTESAHSPGARPGPRL